MTMAEAVTAIPTDVLRRSLIIQNFLLWQLAVPYFLRAARGPKNFLESPEIFGLEAIGLRFASLMAVVAGGFAGACAVDDSFGARGITAPPPFRR